MYNLAINNLKGVYTVDVKEFRKNSIGRYVLVLETNEFNTDERFEMDIHDSLLETIGLPKLNKRLISKIKANLPPTIKISNVYGYLQIENESLLLSDIISKSL